MAKKPPAKYNYNRVLNMYQEHRNERSEWEAEWREISDYLLPGRGIYQTYSQPRKRKLTNKKIINTVAEDSLNILTSGMHGRLTSPAMPWFRLDWKDAQIRGIPQLVAWLEQVDTITQHALHASNFYSIINSFYNEYAGFGNGCMYVGSDTDDDSVPFRFELLTAGEYAFSMGPDGKVCNFFRTIYMSPRKLYMMFPDTVSPELKRKVDNNEAGADVVNLAVVESLHKDRYDDEKGWIRLFYEVTGEAHSGMAAKEIDKRPLQVDGFFENPYPVARWSTIGSDVYGIGPGSRAIPDIKRLQEMEKAFLMATHKSINPPLNAPARLKGKVKSLPGAFNYYSNPQETVNELYQVRFDFPGVSAAIERVEMRVQRNFFNDVFINAMRDPNASPLKATQVQAQEQEKMFRLGPVVERLQSEFFVPLVTRCVNILDRKGLLPELPPEFERLKEEYEITLLSPMAVAQRTVKSQGTDAFFNFVAQAAQFNQGAIDKINIDAAIDQRADIEGVDIGILRTQDEVDQIRQQRAEQQAQAEAQAQQAAQAQMSSELDVNQSQASKNQAEAAATLADAQSMNNPRLQ